jgi:formyltetrahydrofolate-dependent phosphoribosylglycinamide formyltransferase
LTEKTRRLTPRLVVMISGGGTNLQALIDAIAAGHLRAQIALVVSNRKDAYGLQRAERAGIPTLYFPLKPYADAGKTRDAYDADLAARVAEAEPDLIVMAGWMHIVSPAFIDRFPRRIINLHPALPGEFAGLNALERTFESARSGRSVFGGCMVHYVIPEVDAGEVIAVAEVPVLESDTLDSFAASVHAAEHQILVQSVRIVLDRQRADKVGQR